MKLSQKGRSIAQVEHSAGPDVIFLTDCTTSGARAKGWTLQSEELSRRKVRRRYKCAKNPQSATRDPSSYQDEIVFGVRSVATKARISFPQTSNWTPGFNVRRHHILTLGCSISSPLICGSASTMLACERCLVLVSNGDVVAATRSIQPRSSHGHAQKSARFYFGDASANRSSSPGDRMMDKLTVLYRASSSIEVTNVFSSFPLSTHFHYCGFVF